jgi:hypothetical protein
MEFHGYITPKVMQFYERFGTKNDRADVAALEGALDELDAAVGDVVSVESAAVASQNLAKSASEAGDQDEPASESAAGPEVAAAAPAAEAPAAAAVVDKA